LIKKLKTNDNDLIFEYDKFEKKLKILKFLGYHTMTMDEYICWKKGECDKPHKSVLITFDDGWTNNYDYAFELLQKYNMNATVFYIGINAYKDGINYLNLNMINDTKNKYKNIDFCSHSYALHFHSDKSYEEVIEDTNKMKEVLNTNCYAYPYGDYNDNYIKALLDSNYQIAFTFGPGKEHRKSSVKDDIMKVPRLNISNDMWDLKFIIRLLYPY